MPRRLTTERLEQLQEQTTQLPLTLIPLDVTNTVSISKAFLQALVQHSGHPWAYVAGQFWATTVDSVPAYEYTCFRWDALATRYLSMAEAFQLKALELTITLTGSSVGRPQRVPGCGQWVKVAQVVNQGPLMPICSAT